MFSKKIIACSVKYCFLVCSGMFEVYKNRNILQFAPFLVSQSSLEDDGSDSPRLLHLWHTFCTILVHTNMINLMCNWEINEST